MMDANFVGEVPDYLKCVVCHFVFKDPVLIIECGHRLCKKCFEDIGNYSTQHNSPLLCPIDRNEVEADKVIDDKGIHRVVMDLKVRCDQSDHGCTWTGDLGRLAAHKEKDCGAPFLKKFMKEVEERMREKDEQIKDLREMICFNDSSVHQRILLKEEEAQKQRDNIASLERKARQQEEDLSLLRYQVTVLRNGSTDSDGNGRENEVNSTMLGEEDTSTLEKKQINGDSAHHPDLKMREELQRVTGLLKQKDNKISQLEFRLARVTNELFQIRDNWQCSQCVHRPDSESNHDGNHSSNSRGGINEESSLSKEDPSKNNNNSSCSGSSITKNDNHSSKRMNHVANSRKSEAQNNNKLSVTSQTADVIGKKRKFDSALPGSSKDNPGSVEHPSECVRYKEIELFMKHVMNVDEYVPGDRTVFTWKIYDFKHHQKAREQVDSPSFYTSIPGHCCYLFIAWEDNGDLGVYFAWCRGIYKEEIRDVFDKEVTFKSTDKNGKITQHICLKADMKQYFKNHLKEPIGERWLSGHGSVSMFPPALLKRHIIDDTLSITCVVSHR